MLATEKTSPGYDFTQDWFSKHTPVWGEIVKLLPARRKFLEVGSFEGLSACWLLQNILDEDGTLWCIDTWQGSPEFHVLPKNVVSESRQRFDHNISIAKGEGQRVNVCALPSVLGLGGLISQHSETFDFAYIDGSHMAHDVLSDACLTWALMKVGGIIAFDDYLWDLQMDVLNRPKMAIDAFTSMFARHIRLLAIGDQYIIQKVKA